MKAIHVSRPIYSSVNYVINMLESHYHYPLTQGELNPHDPTV